jgi:hypothetical protein
MGYDSFVYNLVLLLHLLTAVVGFGSSFVWPALAARARKMEPAQGYALTNLSLQLGKPLTTYPIYASGAFGLVLVILSAADDFGPYAFDQTWISLAFLLFIAAALVAAFLHYPNLKKMDALQARLVSGEAKRGKQAAMYGGILHLLFLLLMIDMVWKPGSPL